MNFDELLSSTVNGMIDIGIGVMTHLAEPSPWSFWEPQVFLPLGLEQQGSAGKDLGVVRQVWNVNPLAMKTLSRLVQATDSIKFGSLGTKS